MDYNDARRYLSQRPEALEDYPFGPDVAVYKVRGKMFATLSETRKGDREWAGNQAGRLATMNLKCDPDQALALRDIFPAVIPGYHMNKRHWNTVLLDGSVPRGEIERMIDHSYSLVVRSLKKADREALLLRYGREALFRD